MAIKCPGIRSQESGVRGLESAPEYTPLKLQIKGPTVLKAVLLGIVDPALDVQVAPIQSVFAVGPAAGLGGAAGTDHREGCLARLGDVIETVPVAVQP